MQIFIVPLVKIMKDFSNVSFLGYSIIHFYVLDRVGECEKVLLCHLSSRRRTFQSLPLPNTLPTPVLFSAQVFATLLSQR